MQLKKYDQIILNRRKNAEKVIESILQIDNIEIRPYNNDSTYSHLVALVENPDELIEEYRHNYRVQLGTIIDYSIPIMNSYQKNINEKSIFSNSEYYSKHIVNFPLTLENINEK